jgi:hypothetical protein
MISFRKIIAPGFLAYLGFTLASSMPAQAAKYDEYVHCYFFKEEKMAIRDICKRTGETWVRGHIGKMKLMWPDGVSTDYLWASKSATRGGKENNQLDGFDADFFSRSGENFERLAAGEYGGLLCIQAKKSKNSVCLENLDSRWTWQSLIHNSTSLPDTKIYPKYYPKGFRHGMVAFSRLHTSGTTYHVAREGFKIPGQGIASELMMANALDLKDRSRYPGTNQNLDEMFEKKQILRVSIFYPRDQRGNGISSRASSQVKLLSGYTAYLLSDSYCAFTSTSPKPDYDPLVCVASKLDSAENLKILKSIIE